MTGNGSMHRKDLEPTEVGQNRRTRLIRITKKEVVWRSNREPNIPIQNTAFFE
jgi:hypothetical protein